MLLGASSQLMQQIGGCNAVIYYFPILFVKSIGETHERALLFGGINMIVYAIFATTSWFVIERVGRRKLFLWGTAGQGLSSKWARILVINYSLHLIELLISHSSASDCCLFDSWYQGCCQRCCRWTIHIYRLVCHILAPIAMALSCWNQPYQDPC